MKKNIIILILTLFSVVFAYGQNTETTEQKLIKALEEKIQTLETEKSAFENQIQTLETEKSAFENQIQTLETEKSTFENKIQTLETEKSAFENKIKTLETEKSAFENKIKTLETEKNNLDKQLNSNNIKVLKQDKKELETKNNQLETEKNQLETEKKELEGQLVGAKTTIDKYEADKVKFEKQSKDLAVKQEILSRKTEEQKKDKEELDVFMIDVIIACIDVSCKEETINKLAKYYDKIASDSIRSVNQKFRDILSIYTVTETTSKEKARKCLDEYNNATSKLLQQKSVATYIEEVKKMKYVSDGYIKDNNFYSAYLNSLIPYNEIISYDKARTTSEKDKQMEILIEELKRISLLK